MEKILESMKSVWGKFDGIIIILLGILILVGLILWLSVKLMEIKWPKETLKERDKNGK